MLAWIDIETTGLDETKDVILEIGIILTKDDLTEVARQSWMIDCGHNDPESLADEYVQNMHRENRLWDEWCRYQANHFLLPAYKAGTSIESWLERFDVGPQSAVVAGSTVSFDRKFIRHWIADQTGSLDDYFHYRSIDVSVLKEVMRRERPDVFGSRPPKGKNHRVLDDLEESIAEYKHYLGAIRAA